ncbi:MAG: hypothetical protein OXC79_08280 [Candidatus Poribacteria bacterium]|nr:hypothetical protein [Candidatus Poribacteria bacterium]
MITPTLFVGLGTTGTKILMRLRELMYEEYGHGGLPIFRYIAIETDQGMETKIGNTNQMESYERINFVKATIDNFGMINRELQPNDTLYNEHLDNWLNREVLTFAKNFTIGAGHIRTAGRLCLWQNWDKMHSALSTAQSAIHAPASIDTTNDFLANHFGMKGLQIDGNMVGGSTHIYVVGSLCGGTCSGMFIDMAYYCRGLIGAADGNEIHGMFTMFDQYAVNRADEDESLRKVRSANCYGGLWELNYYNHPKTTYDVVLPNNANRSVHADQNPFDDTLLVSGSGKDPDNKFVDKEGRTDLDGLHLMVALNLFAESVGNTRGLKDAMGINGQAIDGYGHLKEVRIGETTVMTRNMASFGLTAVWYPKYRIANATASLVGQKICENWCISHIQEATIIEDAKAEWQQIRDGNIEKLTNPDNLPSIKARIDEHLDKVKKARLNKNISGAALNRFLEDFPEGDSFRKKFAEGGQYIDLMKMQVPECQRAFRNAIENTFNNQLGRIDFEETRGIKDVEVFFNKLDNEIEKEIENCPLQLPTLSLDGLNFKQLDRVGKSFWLQSLWLQDESVESHQRDIINTYCDLIGGSENSFYKEVRKFFLRPILEGIRAELGFGVSPKDTDAPNRRLTIRERLRKIDTNLGNCIGQFKDVYNEAIKPKESESKGVKIVTNNDQNSIDEDAKLLSHQIIEQGGDGGLLDGTTVTAFLQEDHQEIINQMTTTYRGVSLSKMRSHDVVQEVQRYVAAGDHEITNLAHRSNPYQTFDTNNYQPLLGAPPKIIFGRDSVNNVLPQLERRLGFSNSGDCSVDHLLFFYQEEYGFTIDDLIVFPELKQTYFVGSPGKYGHSTHKNPDFYDLELHQKIYRLKWWCGGLAPLVPAVCNVINRDAFDGLFSLDNGMYVYKYYLDGLAETLTLHGDEEGITRLSRSENAEAYDEFVQSVQSKFTELTRKEINNVVDQLTETVLTQRRKLNDFYRILLDEIFTGNMLSDKTFADTEVDLEWSFFQPTPQTQKENTTEEPPGSNQNTVEETAPEADVANEAAPDTEKTADDQNDETDSYDEVISEESE